MMKKITPPAHIAALEPYKPGRPIADVMAEYGLSDVIKLASNENPLGPSPKAMDAAIAAMSDLHHYPNGGKTLRAAIAQKYRLSIDEVIAGSGSEGVMNTLMRTFLEKGDEVLTSDGTFTGFYVLATCLGPAARHRADERVCFRFAANCRAHFGKYEARLSRQSE